MNIQKETLKKALETVKPGLAGKEIIEQSTSFAFMGDRVVTYNDEISISHPVEGLNLTGAIRAEELYQLLSKLKREEIEVEITATEVILSSGKMKAGLILQSEIKLPLEEIGEISKWKTLPENFSEACQFVASSCSTDMSRAILTCVHITGNQVEASDAYQIAQFKFNSGLSAKTNLLIPATSIREVIKINPTKIALGSGWVHFQNEAGTVLSCRIFEDEFPDTSSHMEVEGIEITFPKTIGEILDRASVFSKQAVSTDETITITLDKNRVKIAGKSDSGWFEEEANIKFSEEKTSFMITPSLFRNILNRSNSCVLGSSKVKFSGENWDFMALLKE
jgi:hypothetical protein